MYPRVSLNLIAMTLQVVSISGAKGKRRTVLLLLLYLQGADYYKKDMESLSLVATEKQKQVFKAKIENTVKPFF